MSTLNPTLLHSIAATEAALPSLRTLITSEPAFADWRLSSCDRTINPGHIQLFPVDYSYDGTGRGSPKRLASARVIARAVGGEWTTSDDGMWQCHAPDGGQSWTLHGVEPEVRPTKDRRLVNLDEPAATTTTLPVG